MVPAHASLAHPGPWFCSSAVDEARARKQFALGEISDHQFVRLVEMWID
jgi:hypothetical protein